MTAPSLPADSPEQPLYLCTGCWKVFEDGTAPICPDEYGRCQVSRPTGGWEVLPYRFRSRFHFQRPLGRGGMGAVFHAYDLEAKPGLNEVAVKVVQRVGTTDERAAQIRRFDREAGVAGVLGKHSTFVRVVAHDVQGEMPYLAMEYVPWPTLKQFRGRSTLPPLQVARLGAVLLDGLQRMHFHRYVHRDLKPANLFVRQVQGEYEIKIADLGTCTEDQQAAGAPPPATVMQMILGTRNYMSPEQMRGEAVGCRSDLHTVGSILWELATGRVPYPFPDGDLITGMYQRNLQLLQPPPRPPQMPEELYRILCSALHYDHQQRPQDAAELARQLREFITAWRAAERAAIEQNRQHLEQLVQDLQPVLQTLEERHRLLDQGQRLARDISELRSRLPEWEPERLRSEVRQLGQRLHQFTTLNLPPELTRARTEPELTLTGRPRPWRWLLACLVGGILFGLGFGVGRLTDPTSLVRSDSLTSGIARPQSEPPTSETAHQPPEPPTPGSAADLGIQPSIIEAPSSKPKPNTKIAAGTATAEPVLLEIRAALPPADRVLVDGQAVCQDRRPSTPCPLRLDRPYPIRITVEATSLSPVPAQLILRNRQAAEGLKGSFTFQWQPRPFVP